MNPVSGLRNSYAILNVAIMSCVLTEGIFFFSGSRSFKLWIPPSPASGQRPIWRRPDARAVRESSKSFQRQVPADIQQRPHRSEGGIPPCVSQTGHSLVCCEECDCRVCRVVSPMLRREYGHHLAHRQCPSFSGSNTWKGLRDFDIHNTRRKVLFRRDTAP